MQNCTAIQAVLLNSWLEMQIRYSACLVHDP
uniref:Uncharacterized protein n=1 Tax=Arundo donax TaxID=35708 RepID=A0A0A9GKN7_ARUDO